MRGPEATNGVAAALGVDIEGAVRRRLVGDASAGGAAGDDRSTGGPDGTADESSRVSPVNEQACILCALQYKEGKRKQKLDRFKPSIRTYSKQNRISNQSHKRKKLNAAAYQHHESR